jgi:hypothetical protein
MLTVSDQVQDVLDAEGISLTDLTDMVARAAITSQRGASRRYHHWFFVYDSKRRFVEKMFKHAEGMDDVKRWKKHEHCDGWGCPTCMWSGEVPE